MAEEKKVNRNIILEGVRLAFRNFSGNEGLYNKEGDRNFCVLLTPEQEEKVRKLAPELRIKELKPREEGDLPQPYIEINVYYPKAGSKGRPPEVVLITDKIDQETGEVIGKSRSNLRASTINLLDWAHIVECDLVFRVFQWEMGGATGWKTALNSIYATITMDTLEAKYSNIPDSASSGPDFEEIVEVD